MMNPLIDGSELSRLLDNLLSYSTTKIGTKTGELCLKESGKTTDTVRIQITVIPRGESPRHRLSPTRTIRSLPGLRDALGQLYHLFRIGIVVDARPLALGIVEVQNSRNAQMNINPLASLPLFTSKHLRDRSRLESLGQRTIFLHNGRANLIQ